MPYKKILTIQDISCVGQCSLTVALPILSACGIETCILPSAVLSTHTAEGFSGYTVRDLTEDMPGIHRHWQQEGIRFSAVYTGYLGSIRQMDYVKSIANTMLAPGGLFIVDPAMADFGKLYTGFDAAYVDAMKKLCLEADIILPNITEACLLTGMPYRETYDCAYIEELLKKLTEMGCATVVLTGVGYTADTTGVAVYEQGALSYYRHRRIARNCHGTGDVFASSFVGALMNEKTSLEAAEIAAEFTVRCIENTQDDPDHWYGVKFETVLPDLIEKIK